MRGQPCANRKRDMKILKKRRGLFEGSLWRRGCSRLHSVSKKWQKATFSSFLSVCLSRPLPGGKRCNGRTPPGFHPFRRAEGELPEGQERPSWGVSPEPE